MTPLQIEAWALRVIDRVERKQNVEDVRVELKAEWPTDPNKAARQIGGHANAVRGEPILWLIGVDEKAGKVVGAPYSEFANWYPGVVKQFNGVAPECTPLNIPHDAGTVVALLLEADRQPYVVRNAVHGQPGGGPVAFEVPWRNGPRTDTATRADLIKLLAPVTQVPEVELLAAGLWVQAGPNPNSPTQLTWRLDVYLFVTPRSNAPVVIATHRYKSAIQLGNQAGYELPLSGFSFASEAPGNVRTKGAITINTPGLVIITGQYIQESFTLPLTLQTVRAAGQGRPIGADVSIGWSCELSREFSDRRDYDGIWGYGPFTSF